MAKNTFVMEVTFNYNKVFYSRILFLFKNIILLFCTFCIVLYTGQYVNPLFTLLAVTNSVIIYPLFSLFLTAFLIHIGMWQLLGQMLTYVEKKHYHIVKKLPMLVLYGTQIFYFNPMIYQLRHLSCRKY